MNARRQYQDDLRPARGILTAIILSVILWALVLWAIPAAFADGPDWPPMLSHWRAEGLVGRSHLPEGGDDLWYQSELPYRMGRTSTAVQASVSARFRAFDDEPYAFGLRIALVDLGRAHVDALWVSDAQWAAHDFGEPLWHGVSNWHAYGVSFGPLAEAKAGPVTFGIEAGAFAYRAGGSVNYTAPDGSTGVYDVPLNETHWTDYVGANMRWKWLFASVREYGKIHAQSGDQLGFFNGPAHTAMAGLSVPF